MKRLLSVIALFAIISSVKGQTLQDAYRYSSSELSGTARYIGMSGAFGALGGDISAMSINPASSAVFISSTATASLSYRSKSNDIMFNNGRSTADESDVELDNIGGVFVFTTSDNSDWRKISLGLNYTTDRNFDDSYTVRGTSNNSIDQYFLGYADGVPLELLQLQGSERISDLYAFLGENYGFGAQQAFLGYQGYVIEADADNPENTSYFSLIDAANFDQQYSYVSSGLNGKFTFNMGTQFKDFLYLGLNLNSHFINYENSSELSEFNNNPESATSEVYFGNTLRTNGDGFSFQLGGIAKLGENIRVGLTYDSPTWFYIREETTQYLETNSPLDEFVSVNPRTVNVYPEYRFQIPSKLSASAAYLFGKQGLISLDFGAKDYSNIKFKPENDVAFQDLNSRIEDNMKTAYDLRIGGEYRIANFSLRGGYRLEESPYQNTDIVGDLTGYSAGVGYSFGSINLDLAYSNSTYKEGNPVYNVGLTEPVYIDRDLSKVVLSLTFGL
ncbi:OmpP1/FadL family transporter [Christiangramia sp. SM2212]|uniref:Outer membrane protein transport protein n=1 Tax=Christiangramia sediminicola TaxID=3073267 RepID=A0ABU1ETV7_9FLAO|nr:outer membrane protein transport protein [Christiangramia sp. SM2212]MDR5591843.1 outer membrane protein transport protein [Christiangramia sp. SM2212]